MFNRKPGDVLKKEFEDKIIEHIDSLYNLSLRMTQNKQSAEDLVQEAVLRAFRFFHKFEKGTNFKAWIMTILRNIYINQYRKSIKEPVKVAFAFEEVENFISLPEINGVQEDIFSEAIKSLIDKLSEELRITITLFYADSLSYKEIASVMNCPVGTVMSRLYTARQILKKQLCKIAKEEER